MVLANDNLLSKIVFIIGLFVILFVSASVGWEGITGCPVYDKKGTMKDSGDMEVGSRSKAATQTGTYLTVLEKDKTGFEGKLAVDNVKKFEGVPEKYKDDDCDLELDLGKPCKKHCECRSEICGENDARYSLNWEGWVQGANNADSSVNVCEAPNSEGKPCKNDAECKSGFVCDYTPGKKYKCICSGDFFDSSDEANEFCLKERNCYSTEKRKLCMKP